MELLAGSAVIFVVVAYVVLVLSPWLFLWLAWRAVRHLYHIEVALFQLRDAARELVNTKDPVQLAQLEPPKGEPRVVNSMFGR